MREEHLPSNHALCLIEQPLNSTLVGGAFRKLLQVPGAIEREVLEDDTRDILRRYGKGRQPLSAI